MQKRPYSRLERVQTQQQSKSAAKFIVLSILLVAFLAFLGVPLIVKVVELVSSVNNDTPIVDVNDKTPPAPPRLFNIAQFTKEDSTRIEGNTEAGATVTIHINTEQKETVADASGNFSTRVDLNKGENTIYAVSTDTNNNQSNESQHYAIIFDNEPPKIDISKPTDGQQFNGSRERQITVEGVTDVGAQMTINGRVVIVGSDGKFTFPASLGEGENNFNMKSIDQAGNLTERDLKVTYTP